MPTAHVSTLTGLPQHPHHKKDYNQYDVGPKIDNISNIHASAHVMMNCIIWIIIICYESYSDNLKAQFIIIWIAPFIKAEFFSLLPINTTGC